MDATARTAHMTKYYREDFSALINRKIIDIRAMYPEEMELFGWHHQDPGCVLQLDNGTLFVPMRDAEGNGPGHLAVDEGSK